MIALAAYLLFIGLALRACAMGWHSPGRRFAEMGVAVIIGLSYAGLFEFNWGDTEVFLFLLDIVALVVAMTEPEVAPANAMASLRVAQSVP